MTESEFNMCGEISKDLEKEIGRKITMEDILLFNMHQREKLLEKDMKEIKWKSPPPPKVRR